MKIIQHVLSFLIATLIIATGCITSQHISNEELDPFASEVELEGMQRSFQRRTTRLKQLDPRFAIHIPNYSLTNATIEEAIHELKSAWKFELGSDDLPTIVRIEYNQTEGPKYEGCPGLRQCISMQVQGLSVADILVLMSDLTPHRLKIVACTPVFERRDWIEEDWVTRAIPLSTACQDFLSLKNAPSEHKLMEQLKLYGVTFQDGYGFYARWVPEFKRLVIFNYPWEIDRVEAILGLVDSGFKIEKELN